MTKMNRRNYLSLLGVSGAGLMIGAACKDVSQQQPGQGPTPAQSPTASSETTRPTAARAGICTMGFKDWPPSPLDADHSPSRCESVTLIFDGLMGYFYDQGTAQVGFHPADHKHEPTIGIWEKPDDGSCMQRHCDPKPGPVLANKLKYVDVSVVGRQNKVDYYKPGDCLDRSNGNAMDFRWLIDLEELYGPRKRKKDKFGLVLRIQDGTFYTRTLTDHFFQRVDSRNKLKEQAGTMLGRVPHIMAAAIKLAPGEKLRLELKDKDNRLLELKDTNNNSFANPHDLPLPNDHKVLQVDFLNRCPDCSKPDPCDDDEEKKRNHFHYLRDVLDIPSNWPKYSIALAASATEPLPILPKCDVKGLTYRTDVDYCIPDETMKLTDEAPCAGAGYGSGGGCGCI